MLDAARDAIAHAGAKTSADLESDGLLVAGLTHWVQVIGEAARGVSHETRQSTPEIPWAAIIGMRHVLVHEYDNVNVDLLWQTIVRDLPPLVAALDKPLSTGEAGAP